MEFKNFTPRPSQQAVLDYQAGYMGIAAVPGSGKTQVLSALAANLIASGNLMDEQEVLIVTMTNSAVENFRQRVQKLLRDAGLVSGFGFRVLTLHSLALAIVKSRPDLANLSPGFVIVDEDESNDILQDVVKTVMFENSDLLQELTVEGYFENHGIAAQKSWVEALNKYGLSFAQQAKDYNLLPVELAKKARANGEFDPFFLLGNNIYDRYQYELAARNGIDFADLIRLAYQILVRDPEVRVRLSQQWPYVLEDEAQDSSRLQEEILRLIVGENGNWVRVGDRNQAIYESFTTANPAFLTRFIESAGTRSCELPYSGRSSESIVTLANHLIELTHSSSLPNPALAGSLHYPLIRTTPLGDPQQNPPDRPGAVFILEKAVSSDEEIATVVNSAVRWYAEGRAETAAVLVPDNIKASKIVERLKDRGVEVVELLKTHKDDRDLIDILSHLYAHFAKPYDAHLLSALFTRWQSRFVAQEQFAVEQIDAIKDYLHDSKTPEAIIHPDQRCTEDANNVANVHGAPLQRFIKFLTLAHQLLPLHPSRQILGMIPELTTTNQEIALFQALSRYLHRFQKANPDYNYKLISDELKSVVSGRALFKHNTFDMSGFNPDDHRGKVLVSTMHRAKGLEWDRVYLMGVNNYDFPLAMDGDVFRGELPFLKGRANLEAEMVKQVDLAASVLPDIPENATLAARQKYAAERIRLLFVGITRARKELIITWNNGQNHDMHMAEMLQRLLSSANGRTNG